MKNTNLFSYIMMWIQFKILFFSIILVLLSNSCHKTSDKENFNKRPISLEARVSNRSLTDKKKHQNPTIALYLESLGLVNILELDRSIKVEIKYSTTDNFTGTILYDSLYQAYLHPLAADKLIKAQKLLKSNDTTLSLLIYDAARPMSVQRKMYAVVQNTPYHAYVANPSRTGMHNYGMAVDLTICTEDGTPLDMGTPFDYFGRAAGINKEDQLISEGILTAKQVENRRLLRRIMTEAGFIAIRGEWWHFNASSLEYAQKNISLIE